MIAVLGAGPHGREIASLFGWKLYDDNQPGYEPIQVGAARHPWVAGAAWPTVRRLIAAKASGHTEHDDPILFPGVRVGQDVTFGRQVHVGYNAVISHGCHLGDFVTVCPGAVLAGDAHVADDVFVGANATVIHGGIKIGEGAVIGAGAVVTCDVAPGDVVVGVPARGIR